MMARPMRAAACLLAACLSCFAPASTAQAPVLEVGIVPYLPTAQLIGGFSPLAVFLERRLGRPVSLTTAPDIRAHLQRALRHEYALVITGPSPGRLLQRDAGYVPLLVSRRSVQAVILVPKEVHLASTAELRGKRVAGWEKMSATALLGNEMLRRAQLDPERDATLLELKSPYNAAQALTLGDADAAIVPVQLLPGLPAEMKAGLRVLARSRELPGIIVLARHAPGLPDPERLRGLLLEFFEGEEAGRNLVAQLEYDGFRPPGAAELASLDALLPETRRALDR